MQLEPVSKRTRRLSLTSLIDVIFLLLLFFILSSTFTKYARVDIASVGGGQSATQALPEILIQVRRDQWSINGRRLTPDLAIAELQALENRGAVTALVIVGRNIQTQHLVTALERIRNDTSLFVTVGK